MASTSGSIIRLKIEGDSGHPWWVPYDLLNGLERRPEVWTWAEV